MIIARSSRSDADRVTLDQLIKHNAQRMPDQVALVDAAHRPRWSEGRVRRLTWAEVETASNAMARRLAGFGLPSDSVVALQGGASVDTVIALFACMKANLLPAMLPITWRNAEVSAAVTRTGAKALITEVRIGAFLASEALREVAAENFSVRFVCAIGGEPPDGVIGLDDCYGEAAAEAPARAPRFGNAAEHVAAITFDGGPTGPFPVARSHNEWLTAGLATLAEYRLTRESVILSTMALSSLPGLGGALMPWLMSGCRLALHQAFDRKEFAAQINSEGATHVVMPSVVADAASREKLLQAETIDRVVSVMRFGQAQPIGLATRRNLLPLVSFGEVGLVAGAPVATSLPAGIIRAPFGVADGVAVVDLAVLDGVLAARGAMTPQGPLAGQERGAPYPVQADGYVLTGYPALLDGDMIRANGPRRDVITIGGESLSVAMLETVYGDLAGVLSVGVKGVPDPILGERLVLEAMPESDAAVSAVSLAMHAEGKGVSPLAQTAETTVGDRRKPARMAGAA